MFDPPTTPRNGPDLLDLSPPASCVTVAVDGGTTNTRARVLRGLSPTSEARRAVGARDVALGGGPAPLAEAIRDVIIKACRLAGVDRPDRVVASGMLTSEVGLTAVPHAPAPAGVEDLARAAVERDLPEVAPRPILLIPGVRTPPGDGPDGWARADVMRGEECEAIGLAARMRRQGLLDPRERRRLAFLLPGSHTKLLVAEWTLGSFRILSSYTTLAGELLATLARHTILAASLPAELPQELDQEALEAGVRLGREVGLGRAAFLVRIAALSLDWSPEQRAGFLIGAVVAEDVGQLMRHPSLGGDCDSLLVVGGSEPLRGVYARLIPRPVTPLACDHASAVGAALVAQARLGPPA